MAGNALIVDPSQTASRHDLFRRLRRLIWLLDRLAPATASSIFEPLITDDMALFAWGRRLPPNQRYRLIDSGLQQPQRLQAAMIAWCESCPDEHLSSLLDWVDVWRPVLDPKLIVYCHAPEGEFYRRCTDAAVRRQHLDAHVDRTLARLSSSHETTREIAKVSRRWLRMWILREAARRSDAPPPPRKSTEEWIAWFRGQLASPGLERVTRLDPDLLEIRRYPNEHLARYFWVHSHGIKEWRSLHNYAFSTPDSMVFDRLAEIVPENHLDAWDDLLLNQPVNHGEIRAFCRWLPRKLVEVLRGHFCHPDPDWSGCAYQNYLAKASPLILHHWWRRMDDLPRWQVGMLDRRLFAPEAVRPQPIVEDVQLVESDVRLEDPFNLRAL